MGLEPEDELFDVVDLPLIRHLTVPQEGADDVDALPHALDRPGEGQAVLRLDLDLVAGAQAQYESAVGVEVDGGGRHGDGRSGANEDAADGRAQEDALRGHGAGRQDGELIATVSLGHPRRLVAQLLGQLDALHDLRGLQALREGHSKSLHVRTSLVIFGLQGAQEIQHRLVENLGRLHVGHVAHAWKYYLPCALDALG